MKTLYLLTFILSTIAATGCATDDTTVTCEPRTGTCDADPRLPFARIALPIDVEQLRVLGLNDAAGQGDAIGRAGKLDTFELPAEATVVPRLSCNETNGHGGCCRYTLDGWAYCWVY